MGEWIIDNCLWIFAFVAVCAVVVYCYGVFESAMYEREQKRERDRQRRRMVQQLESLRIRTGSGCSDEHYIAAMARETSIQKILWQMEDEEDAN